LSSQYLAVVVAGGFARASPRSDNLVVGGSLNLRGPLVGSDLPSAAIDAPIITDETVILPILGFVSPIAHLIMVAEESPAVAPVIITVKVGPISLTILKRGIL
jgi:hypothetical protein